MASPFLDVVRLEDVIQIFLKHNTAGQMNTFFTRQKCDGEKLTVEIQKEAAANLPDKLKTLVEYKIYRRMIYPQNRFHAKFIAAVIDNEAEVLVTSANFHANHFAINNMETVSFSKMDKERFETEFLDPISVPAVART